MRVAGRALLLRKGVIVWRCVVDKCGLESVLLYCTLNVDIHKTVDWIVSRLEKHGKPESSYSKEKTDY